MVRGGAGAAIDPRDSPGSKGGSGGPWSTREAETFDRLRQIAQHEGSGGAVEGFAAEAKKAKSASKGGSAVGGDASAEPSDAEGERAKAAKSA